MEVPNNGWIKEKFNFNPTTPYAVSRASCDLHLMSFYKAYDFPVVLQEQQMFMAQANNFTG